MRAKEGPRAAGSEPRGSKPACAGLDGANARRVLRRAAARMQPSHRLIGAALRMSAKEGPRAAGIAARMQPSHRLISAALRLDRAEVAA